MPTMKVLGFEYADKKSFEKLHFDNLLIPWPTYATNQNGLKKLW